MPVQMWVCLGFPLCSGGLLISSSHHRVYSCVLVSTWAILESSSRLLHPWCNHWNCNICFWNWQTGQECRCPAVHDSYAFLGVNWPLMLWWLTRFYHIVFSGSWQYCTSFCSGWSWHDDADQFFDDYTGSSLRSIVGQIYQKLSNVTLIYVPVLFHCSGWWGMRSMHLADIGWLQC